MLKRIISLLIIISSLLCRSVFAHEEMVNIIIETENSSVIYEIHNDICKIIPEASDIIYIYNEIFCGFSLDVPLYSVDIIKNMIGV